MNKIESQTFDEERALYGSNGLTVSNCAFDGPADGESAFKECTDITAENCFYNLRYPFWHVHGLNINGGEMTELCRAALWYSDHIEISDLKMHGIKALRECSDVTIRHCDITSPEFGWSTRDITMEDTTAESEYFMMRSEDLHFKNVKFSGKYSFQYIRNAVFENCIFSTKDAFWHGENITVRNSVIKGEYLAWYSDGLTLENCKIIGTQPFCYCKNLRLINCEMLGCDLAFEKSDVEATITTPVISIKNPSSGHITVPAVEEIICDDKKSKAVIMIEEEKCSADALRDLLYDSDLTIDMHDYGSFEKVGEIGHTLPQNNTQITTEPGDVILYLGTNITIYYDKNSWNFTRLGKIQDVTKKELLSVFGDGNVTVTFSLTE